MLNKKQGNIGTVHFWNSEKLVGKFKWNQFFFDFCFSFLSKIEKNIGTTAIYMPNMANNHNFTTYTDAHFYFISIYKLKV